jgi:hypothetical protein
MGRGFVGDTILAPRLRALRRRPAFIDGHTATRVSYFEEAKTPHLGFGYVAALSVELVPGSWLNIGTISENATGQTQMMAVLRTVRLPNESAMRSVAPLCPPSRIDTAGWQPVRLKSIPVSFLAPPGASMRTGYSTEVWNVASMRVDFVPLRIRAWRFDPAGSVDLWCQMERSGRTIELQVASDFPGTSLGIAKLRAYIRLSTDSVLHVYGWIQEDKDGSEILRTMLGTVRY